MCRADHHAGRAYDRAQREWARAERRYGGGTPAPPTVVRTPDDIRVSDDERMAVVAELQRHVGDGRLSLEEFEERTDEAMRARTGADLRRVLRELPPPAVPAPPRARRPHRERRPPRERRPVPGWLILVAVLVPISLVVGHFVWWSMFLLFFIGCGNGGNRRHHHHTSHAHRPDDRESATTYV